MNGLKKRGEKVKARTFERQVMERNVRAVILSRFTKLGCPKTISVGSLRLGLGRSGLRLLYAT